MRVTVTIPSDGSRIPIDTAGRAFYVESVVDSSGAKLSSPIDVPLIFAEAAGAGLPAYTKARAIYRRRFSRLLLEGTAASAGGTLRLFIGDPCDLIGLPQCAAGDGATAYYPVGDPTHVLVSNGAEILSIDLASGTETKIRPYPGNGFTDIGALHVDYSAGWIYFTSYDNEISRINFDGTGEEVVANTALTGRFTTAVGVSLDPALHKLLQIAHTSGELYYPDGTGQYQIPGSLANATRMGSPQGDGTHFYYGYGTYIRLANYAGNIITGVAHSPAYHVRYDPLGEWLYAGSQHVGLVRYSKDLSQSEELQPDSEWSGEFVGSIFERQLYFIDEVSSGAAPVQRLQMDSGEIETIGTAGVTAPAYDLWPFWP